MMLFSATYDGHVMDFAENIIPNPGIAGSRNFIFNNNLLSRNDLLMMHA